MAKVYFKKSKNGGWYPCDEEGNQYSRKQKPGTIIEATVKKIRNYKFLQKIMTLFRYMNDVLPEPEPIKFMGKTITPAKSFEATRKYLVVQAGYYDVFGLPNGKVRVEPQSLSYGNMSEEKFEIVYSAVIDASLKALPTTWSMEDLKRAENEIMRYV